MLYYILNFKDHTFTYAESESEVCDKLKAAQENGENLDMYEVICDALRFGAEEFIVNYQKDLKTDII